MTRIVRVALVSFVAFSLSFAAPALFADSVLFKDGRYFEVPRLEVAEKSVTAHFKYGSIAIDKALLQDWFTMTAAGDFEPRNDEEKAKVEKGLVPFDGKWITKAQRDQTIDKRNKDRIQAFETHKQHSEWRNRYKGETPHFTFEYTVPPAIAKGYMDLFEVYYDVFSKEWGAKQPAGKKLPICFYANMDDFQRISGAGGGVLGYFRFVEPLELNFFYERRDERLTLDVLFHETNHYLFHLFSKEGVQLPAWIEEGMAEYYGASEWDPKSKKMTLGKLQEGRLINLVDAMDGGDNQDLRDLLDEPRIDALQYAWSWTLCHMLMENKATRSKFKDYVGKLAKDTKLPKETWPGNPNFQWVKPDAAIELFQKTFGIKDLEAFEADWYAYIRKLEVQSDRGFHDAAMFCLRWDRPLRAAKYFEQAVERYSKNPSTYLEYGQLLIRQSKPMEAVRILELGLKLDPMDPYMYRELGRAHRAQDAEDKVARGKQYQMLAWELDPNDLGLISDFDEDMLAKIMEP
jgi:hypothetical protein